MYPILRAESRESFARLMERYPQPEPQTEYRTETVAVYPAEENHLPYDIVVEKLHIEEPEKPEPPKNFRITDYKDGTLAFRSYYYARQIFDLSEYYRIASNTDVQAFTGAKLIYCSDPEEYMKKADTWERKKIASIMDSGLLVNHSAKIIDAPSKKLRVIAKEDA